MYAEALYGNLHFGWSPLAALTTGRLKYIRAPREELFDLARDPRERENSVDERAKERQALSAGLDRLTPRRRQPGFTETLADPKDTYDIVETYRAAAQLAGARKWAQAIRLLQTITRQHDDLAEVWNRLAANAMRIERFDLAADAYARACELQPKAVSGCLGEATALLKLRRFEEARSRAQAVAEATDDRSDRAAAHTVLARIALARHDADAAREEAEHARDADAEKPLAPFVEARLLYDEGRYGDALPLFEEALKAAKGQGTAPFADLHFDTADTLVRLDRPDEAEAQYVEELRDFPENGRASAALAMLYHNTGRHGEASRVLTEMLAITPTPETYALAARMWTAFGDALEAAAARAEARKGLSEVR